MNAMNRRVLSLCTPKKRDIIQKALMKAQYKISFISALNEVTSAIAAFKPRLFIHDWTALQDSQSRNFHLKFSHTTQALELVRIIIVDEISPSILAFASDSAIDKVYTLANASLCLGQEVEMLVAANEGNELNKVLRETKNDSYRYDQSEIDLRIEDLYGKYAHDPRVRLEFGHLSFRRENFEEAVVIAKSLLQKEPQNMRALNLMAKCLMKQGQWDQALQLMQTAQVLNPDNPERLIMMGDALYGKGDLDQAMAYYQNAANVDSDYSAIANKQIGKIHFDQGKVEDAIDLFKGSMSEEEAAGFFNNAAVHAVREKKLDVAMELYQAALKALVTDRLKPLIYFNMALNYQRLGEISESVKSLKRALHYDPKYEKARIHLDSILKREGQMKKAS